MNFKGIIWDYTEDNGDEVPTTNGAFHIHGGTPKWLVYFMGNPIHLDDLGIPLFQETMM